MFLRLSPGRAEITATNRPFAGVSYFSETRSDPPARLFVAQVDVRHPAIRLRVARGGDDPDGAGPWQTTLMQPTKIAARDNLSLVVNGDFFRVPDDEPTSAPFRYRADRWSRVNGAAMTDGVTWAVSTNARPCLVVHADGSVRLASLTKPAADAREVIGGDALLLKDGGIVAPGGKDRHPRTAVGLDANRARLTLLVVDGRKPGLAIGMTYSELAAEMLRLGCRDALNLDGGGSSVIAIREAGAEKLQILNQPSDGRERAVANVLGVVINNSTNK